MYKKIKGFLFFLVGIVLFAVSATALAFQEELASEHFKVSFTGDKNFAKEVLDKAEYYYRNIGDEFGYAKYSKFWSWNSRVKITIYPDHDSYIKGTNQPQWSDGVAFYDIKEIAGYNLNAEFTESILPHEIAHMIFLGYLGQANGKVPLWLYEGVAQWAEELRRDKRRHISTQLHKKGKMLSIKDLMRINSAHFKRENRLFIRPAVTREGEDGVLFLDTEALVDVFYIGSFSLVDFLIERYGAEMFSEFCRQLRDGKTAEEALSFAYPSYIRNKEELAEGWRKYLEASIKDDSDMSEEYITGILRSYRHGEEK
ncbi:MAG: hypothetical protein V2A72_00925 [Candidatus Omnitrophota bacterium]